jgi:hypothetical protein
MFSRKIYGIMIILLLAAGVAITTTRCYDDKNEARVTIHLERNDLAAMGFSRRNISSTECWSFLVHRLRQHQLGKGDIMILP